MNKENRQIGLPLDDLLCEEGELVGARAAAAEEALTSHLPNCPSDFQSPEKKRD
jgi:hypothetical protein